MVCAVTIDHTLSHTSNESLNASINYWSSVDWLIRKAQLIGFDHVSRLGN